MKAAIFFAAAVFVASAAVAETAAEQAIRASVCGEWKPGSGLSREVVGNRVILRGWVHSIVPGRHVLHIAGGTVKVFNQPTNVFEQQAGSGRAKTLGYHQVKVIAPAGAVLEWTLPDGRREPVPSIYLYPA